MFKQLKNKLAQLQQSSLNKVRSALVKVADTPNEKSLKFLPIGKEVLGKGRALEFRNYRTAKSPLARELFKISGVTNVFFGDQFITVSVIDPNNWAEVKPGVYDSIIRHFQSGRALLDDDVDSTTEVDEEEDEVVELIKELIETKIKPTVQYDGGDVSFVGFNKESGVVSLQMHGACVGCSQSAVTLHNGIERMLKYYVPEVTSVEEVIEEEKKQFDKTMWEQFERTVKKLEQEKEGKKSAS